MSGSSAQLFDNPLPLGTLADGVVAHVAPSGVLELVDSAGIAVQRIDWWIGAADGWHRAGGASSLRAVAVDGAPVYDLALRVPGGDIVCRVAASRRDDRPEVGLTWTNLTAMPVSLAVVAARLGGDGEDRWQVVGERAWRGSGGFDDEDSVDGEAITRLTSPVTAGATALPDARVAVGVVPLTHAVAGDGDPVPTGGVVIGRGDLAGPVAVADGLSIARGWTTLRRHTGSLLPPDDELAGVLGLAASLDRLDPPGVPALGRRAVGDGVESVWWDAVMAVLVGDVASAAAWVQTLSARQWRRARPELVITLVWTLVGAGLDRSEWDPLLIRAARAAERLVGGDATDGRSATELVALVVALLDLAGDAAAASRLATAGTAMPPEPAVTPGAGGSPPNSAGPADGGTSPGLRRTAVQAVRGRQVTLADFGPVLRSRGRGPAASPADSVAIEVLGILSHVTSRAERIDLWPMWPTEWNGRPAELHGVASPWGRVSAALRWHGSRPALLWEVDPWGDDRSVSEPRLAVPTIDPGAMLRGWRGESFLAAPTEIAPSPVTIGLAPPVRRRHSDGSSAGGSSSAGDSSSGGDDGG